MRIGMPTGTHTGMLSDMLFGMRTGMYAGTLFGMLAGMHTGMPTGIPAGTHTGPPQKWCLQPTHARGYPTDQPLAGERTGFDPKMVGSTTQG